MKTSRLFTSVLLLLCILSYPLSSYGVGSKDNDENEKEVTTRILFIFDASQSMVGRWQSGTKFQVATNLFNRILDSLEDKSNVQIALRLYGANSVYPPKDCNDTELKVPFSEGGVDNIEKVRKTLAYVRPKGTSPIALSLQESINDFPPCEDCRDLIVLITDGLEECDGDLCAIAKALKRANLSLKPFIIGIGKDYHEDFDCVGTYFDASLEYQFVQALELIVSLALNSTSYHIELLDLKKQPKVSNVAISLYRDKQIESNFIHSIPKDGTKDTMAIDPIPTYKFVVHTIPPIIKEEVKFKAGKHNVIKIPASQGYLWFRTPGNLNNRNKVECIIRQTGKHQTINFQRLGSKERYLTGCYDIEILTRPRIYLDNVCVNENLTTMVEVPASGIASFTKGSAGYGTIFYEPSPGNIEWVYNLNPENYSTEHIYLLPGNYRVVFRTKKADKSVFTIEKKFKVNAGKTTNIKLYK
ncbi:MAG: VWA domain-containing protein [Bacteroidales bacterium]